MLEIINDILETYTIPFKHKCKIANITNVWFRDHPSINPSYQAIYSRIANLVEKWRRPYNEVSCELLEAVFADDPVIEESEDELELSLSDVKDILSSDTFNSMLNLLNFRDYAKFKVSPRYLLENAAKIEEGIEKVVRNNGVFLRRPIMEVTATFKIKFGERKFNGDPLSYFRRNYDLYEGLSRKGLYKKDRGIYSSLLRYGQMADAIPETIWRNYNGNPMVYFREHEDEYKGLSRRGLYEKDTGMYQALLKYKQLDEAIPEIKDGGFKPVAASKIKKLFKVYKGDATIAAKKVGIATATATTYLRKAGFEIAPLGFLKNRIPEEVKKAVVDAHKKNNIASQVADNFCIAGDTVLRFWREAGLPILPQGMPGRSCPK